MLKLKIIANNLLSTTDANSRLNRPISFAEFYNSNRKFYDVGLHTSGFPHDFITSDGYKAPWTQPTSIGFYLQYLVNENNAIEAERVLNTLLEIQSNPNISWNGLIPWLKFNGDDILADRNEIAFGDNSNLSLKVAMVAQKFTGNASVLAKQFLNNQKDGYQQMYNQSQGLFCGTVDRLTGQLSQTYHINRLLNEFRTGVAFVVAYYDVNENAWDNLFSTTSTGSYTDRSDGAVLTSRTLDGSGFQYSWPLLSIPEGELSEDMKNVLYNALYTQLVNANINGHVGGYSASSFGNDETPNGYSGKIGITEDAETDDQLSQKIFSIYSLVPFLSILDKQDKETLMKWVTAFSEYPEIKSEYGYYDSVYDSPKGKIVSNKIEAVDNGSMILANSQGPNLLMEFLDAAGKGNKLRELYGRIKIGIQKFNKPLPSPNSLTE